MLGTLVVNGDQPGSDVTLNAGSLRGSGTVGRVIAGQSADHVLQPGAFNAPILKVVGDLRLSNRTTFIPVTSANVARGVKVTGAVRLGNARLSATTGGAPSVGTVLIIVDNDGSDAVVGNFADTPEGSLVTASGSTDRFRVSYVGGDGNDVTLTRIESDVSPTPTPDPTATPTPAPTGPSQPLNISTRLRVETGNNVMIGGFIITGNDSKKVIIRALGPSLQSSGVNNAVADPVLELRGSGGELIFENDNWRGAQEAEIEASTVPPPNDLEAAIVATLAPGAYTAVVTGKNETTGVGLVEAYDLNQPADSQLANISTRGLVLTDSNVLIGGFILGGSDEGTRVVVRALGPSLSGAGVANPLENPTLDLRDGNGVRLIFNDNWKDDPEQAAELVTLSIAPQNDLEAAIVARIPLGWLHRHRVGRQRRHRRRAGRSLQREVTRAATTRVASLLCAPTARGCRGASSRAAGSQHIKSCAWQASPVRCA